MVYTHDEWEFQLGIYASLLERNMAKFVVEECGLCWALHTTHTHTNIERKCKQCRHVSYYNINADCDNQFKLISVDVMRLIGKHGYIAAT